MKFRNVDHPDKVSHSETTSDLNPENDCSDNPMISISRTTRRRTTRRRTTRRRTTRRRTTENGLLQALSCYEKSMGSSCYKTRVSRRFINYTDIHLQTNDD